MLSNVGVTDCDNYTFQDLPTFDLFIGVTYQTAFGASESVDCFPQDSDILQDLALVMKSMADNRELLLRLA